MTDVDWVRNERIDNLHNGVLQVIENIESLSEDMDEFFEDDPELSRANFLLYVAKKWLGRVLDALPDTPDEDESSSLGPDSPS